MKYIAISITVHACVSVCVRERETESVRACMHACVCLFFLIVFNSTDYISTFNYYIYIQLHYDIGMNAFG